MIFDAFFSFNCISRSFQPFYVLFSFIDFFEFQKLYNIHFVPMPGE